MLIAFNLFGITRVAANVLIGVAVWVCVLKSGVHATLVGVAVVFFIPLNRSSLDGAAVNGATTRGDRTAGYEHSPVFAGRSGHEGLIRHPLIVTARRFRREHIRVKVEMLLRRTRRPLCKESSQI